MGFNNLDEIRVFNQVVLSGGFSAASSALKLPTNIVSRKIATLETRLGIRLLNRTTRKISLTSEGKILFDRSTSLLREFDCLELELTKAQTEIYGTVRLAVRTTTVEFGLLDALTEFLNKHTSLEIHLLVSDTPPDMAGAGIDLALMIGDLPNSMLVAKKIGDVVFCLCASCQYISDPTIIKSLDDLADYNYILPWQKKAGYSLTLRRQDDTLFHISPKSRFQSNDVRTRAAAIYAGLGIGALPLAEVEQKVSAGVLVRILPDYTLPLIPVWSVKSKEKKDDPRLRLIEDLLQSVVLKMGSMQMLTLANNNI